MNELNYLSLWLWHSLWSGFLVWAVLILVMWAIAPRQPETRHRLLIGALACWFLLIVAAVSFPTAGVSDYEIERAVCDTKMFLAQFKTTPSPTPNRAADGSPSSQADPYRWDLSMVARASGARPPSLRKSPFEIY
ncbi:MAG: hypothetical protein KF708_01595 [Pirellulales bacterium]|nr:hypothetical protein [Pirellulales bacterium]